MNDADAHLNSTKGCQGCAYTIDRSNFTHFMGISVQLDISVVTGVALRQISMKPDSAMVMAQTKKPRPTRRRGVAGKPILARSKGRCISLPYSHKSCGKY
jgi:hypothetical protein